MRRVAAIAALLLIALAIWLARPPDDETPPQDRGRGSARIDVAEESVLLPGETPRRRVQRAEERPRDDEVDAPDSDATTEDTDARQSVRVVVRDEDGPVHGATVSRLALGTDILTGATGVTARTDASGEVSWTGLEERGCWLHATLGDRGAHPVLIVFRPNEHVDVTLELADAVGLRGIVIAEDGSAAEKAMVRIEFVMHSTDSRRVFGFTDDNGEFSVPPAPLDDVKRIVVLVDRDGHRRFAQEVSLDRVRGGERVEVRITAVVVMGRIVDEAGDPVFGATIVTKWGNGTKTRSGEGGLFQLDLRRLGDHLIAVYAPNYATREIVSPGPATSGTFDVGTIVLQRGTSLTGVVQDEDGQPIARAVIQVALQDGPGVAQAGTDEDGRFEVARLTDREHVLEVTRETGRGIRRLPTTVEHVHPAGGPVEVVLPRHVESHLRFDVEASGAERPTSISVRIRQTGSDTWLHEFVERGLPMVRGVYVELPAEGDYDVLISARGFEPLELLGLRIRRGGPTIDIGLEPLAEESD